jgi:hypothetical protein
LIIWIIKQAAGSWDHIKHYNFLQQANKKYYIFFSLFHFALTRNEKGLANIIQQNSIYSMLVLTKQLLPDRHSEENKDVVKQQRLTAGPVLETLFVKLILLPNPIPFLCRYLEFSDQV